MALNKSIDSIHLADFRSVRGSLRTARMLDQVPNASGVYALFDGAGLLLKIGMSSDLNRRVWQQLMVIGMPVDQVAFLRCDESTARSVERKLARQLRPPFNLSENGWNFEAASKVYHLRKATVPLVVTE